MQIDLTTVLSLIEPLLPASVQAVIDKIKADLTGPAAVDLTVDLPIAFAAVSGITGGLKALAAAPHPRLPSADMAFAATCITALEPLADAIYGQVHPVKAPAA
jgi:hypothetical protein